MVQIYLLKRVPELTFLNLRLSSGLLQSLIENIDLGFKLGHSFDLKWLDYE